MNLLEHYIIEIHNTYEIQGHPDMIEVDATTDCWGCKERKTHYLSKKQLELAQKQGYFLA